MQQIRVATTADAVPSHRFGTEVIPEVYGPIASHEYLDTLLTSFWSIDRLERDIADDVVLVATDSTHDGVVGFLHLAEYDGEPVIWKVYLLPRFRNRGLGERLIDRAISMLDADAPSVVLEHHGANDAAGRFYERLGFHVYRQTGDQPDISIWRRKMLRHA